LTTSRVMRTVRLRGGNSVINEFLGADENIHPLTAVASRGGEARSVRTPSRCHAQLRILGDWNLVVGWGDSTDSDPLPIALAPDPQHLIAFLALHGRCARAQVAGTLWPQHTDQVATSRLRALLWRLRHRYPDLPPLLEISDLSLALTRNVLVDVDGFAAAAQSLIRCTGDLDEEAATIVLDSAELLPGWYDDWVLAARERLWHLRLGALDALATKLHAQQRHHEALLAALAASRIEPLRESSHRTIARIHLDNGNIFEAVRHYERFQLLLDRELGLRPSERFTDLMRPYLRRTQARRIVEVR
jgi:DNA-binding SARP family transcriptional activator